MGVGFGFRASVCACSTEHPLVQELYLGFWKFVKGRVRDPSTLVCWIPALENCPLDKLRGTTPSVALLALLPKGRAGGMSLFESRMSQKGDLCFA